MSWVLGWVGYLIKEHLFATYMCVLVALKKSPVGGKGEPSTLNPQPSTLNPQPSTLKPQPSTLNPQPSSFNLQLFFLLILRV